MWRPCRVSSVVTWKVGSARFCVVGAPQTRPRAALRGDPRMKKGGGTPPPFNCSVPEDSRLAGCSGDENQKQQRNDNSGAGGRSVLNDHFGLDDRLNIATGKSGRSGNRERSSESDFFHWILRLIYSPWANSQTRDKFQVCTSFFRLSNNTMLLQWDRSTYTGWHGPLSSN